MTSIGLLLLIGASGPGVDGDRLGGRHGDVGDVLLPSKKSLDNVDSALNGRGVETRCGDDRLVWMGESM